MDKPVQIKAVMVGDSGVGKSSVLLRFANDEFDQFSQPTLGAAFVSKTLDIQQRQVKFQIWDTAGQEKYQAIAPIYYRQSQVAICVYDITVKNSFLALEKWIKLIKENGPGIKLLAIVGNKIDKADNEEVSYAQAKQFSEKYNAVFKITSAKDGKGINELFKSLAKTYTEWEETGKNPTQNPENRNSKVKLTESEQQKKNGKKQRTCCK